MQSYSKSESAGFFLKHLAIAWIGVWFLCAACAIVLSLAGVNDAIFEVPNSAPIFAGWLLVGAALGYAFNRKDRSYAACFVFLPPFLLFLWDVWVTLHLQPPYGGWANVWHGDFSRNGSVEEAILTAPLYATIAYSLGAWWSRRSDLGRGRAVAGDAAATSVATGPPGARTWRPVFQGLIELDVRGFFVQLGLESLIAIVAEFLGLGALGLLALRAPDPFRPLSFLAFASGLPGESAVVAIAPALAAFFVDRRARVPTSIFSGPAGPWVVAVAAILAGFAQLADWELASASLGAHPDLGFITVAGFPALGAIVYGLTRVVLILVRANLARPAADAGGR